MLQGIKVFARILFFYKGRALSASMDVQSLAAGGALCLRRRHFKEEEEEEDPLRGSSDASPASGLSAATGPLTG